MSALPDADAGDFDVVVAEAAVVDAVAAEAKASRTESGTDACPNCGAARTGNFCAHCGQRAAPIAPTLGYFLHELTREVLNLDGKIFRSLRLLLTRPGFLTRELFAGRRASYVAPLRLYLVASVFMFALTTLFGSFAAGVNIQYTTDPGEQINAEQIAQVAAAREAVTAALNVWLPRAMFVLVPLFAALVMLFRRHSGYTYPQHLYFALHVHAAWFFANGVNALVAGAVRLPYAATIADTVTDLYMVGYLPFAFARAYGTGLFGTLWRSLTIGLLYFFAVVVTLLSIAAPTALPLLLGQSQ